jgi:hypothetical protein
MGKAVSFPDIASARAAFALGPVTYRCLACGREHQSGTKAALRCLEALRGCCRWTAVVGPLPPNIACSAPLAFVSLVWLRESHAFSAGEVELDEFLLALEPGPGLSGQVREYLASKAEARGAGRVKEQWAKWEALVSWKKDLLCRRPPAEIVGAAREHPRLEPFPELAVLSAYVARPSVPCPGGPEEIEVPEYWLQRYLPRPPRGARRRLLDVWYAAECFFAISLEYALRWKEQSGRWVWYPTCFVVYREKYGSRGGNARVEIPEGADLGKMFQDLAASVRRKAKGVP